MKKLGFLENNVECCLTLRGTGFDFDLIRNVCLCVFQCVYLKLRDGNWENDYAEKIEIIKKIILYSFTRNDIISYIIIIILYSLIY